jgi:hypothetical protein
VPKTPAPVPSVPDHGFTRPGYDLRLDRPGTYILGRDLTADIIALRAGLRVLDFTRVLGGPTLHNAERR